MAVLCSILDNAPYWVSSEDTGECNLVQLDNNVCIWVASRNRVHAYRCITYHLESNMCTFIALNRGVSGQDDIKADAVAFYNVKPRGALWPCEAYAVTNNNGDLLPRPNIIPLETPDDIPPPPPPLPPKSGYPPPNPDLKQDVIQMMGPAVCQLEHHIIDNSSDTEEQPAGDSSIQTHQTPKGAPPPPPPDAPPRHIVIKREPVGELPDPSTDDSNASTGLVPAQPNAEEDTALDTTFNESVDSGAQHAIPSDHTYPAIPIQAPDGAGDTTQQPTSSTSSTQPPVPPGTPSQTATILAPTRYCFSTHVGQCAGPIFMVRAWGLVLGIIYWQRKSMIQITGLS